MTKQEAIDVLQNTIVRFGRGSGKTVYAEALDMAIEALSNTLETLECVGGLIRRQEAIDAITSICDSCDSIYCGDCRVKFSGERDCTTVLMEFPSAQPEIKCIAKVTLTDEQVKEAFEKAKADILAAQPEQQWIPVTERLPDKECFCLVTVNDGAVYTDLSLFKKDGKFIEHTGDVIAWMPLPEPYRREGKQDGRNNINIK